MKKLFPALCMLLVAAALLGTSTYAWFSMNETVEATGMSVSAVADDPYLIIAAGTTLEGSAIKADVQRDVVLDPVTPAVELTADNIETATSWKIAVGESATDGSAKEGDYTTLADNTKLFEAETGHNAYLLKQSFVVGRLASAAEVTNNLKMTLDMHDSPGLTVVVICDDFMESYAADVTTAVEIATAAEVNAEDGVQIDVYIYIDGDNTGVTSANVEALEGSSVALTFSVDVTEE